MVRPASLASQSFLAPNSVFAADNFGLVLRQPELGDGPTVLGRLCDEGDAPGEQAVLEGNYPLGPLGGRFAAALGDVVRLDERGVALVLGNPQRPGDVRRVDRSVPQKTKL